MALLALPAYLPEDYFPDERSDAANNRKRILAQAKVMLQRMTIQELRMSDLAAEAGVGKGTLYRRFDNKSALAKALVIEEFLELYQALMAKVERGMDAEKVIYWFVRSLVRFNITHGALLSATIMREDMPRDWWLESGVMVWLKDTFASLYVSIRPDGDGQAFAANLVPALMLVSSQMTESTIRSEAKRLEWLVSSLLAN